MKSQPSKTEFPQRLKWFVNFPSSSNLRVSNRRALGIRSLSGIGSPRIGYQIAANRASDVELRALDEKLQALGDGHEGLCPASSMEKGV